jgi:membrane-associated protease RseP (regulator of RpoE activity)
MVGTLTWILAGILVYWIVATALRARGLLPDSIRVQGPITTIHTKRGRALLDKIATPRRFWRAWGNLGVGIALVIMIMSFVYVILSGIFSLLNPTALSPAVRKPQNVLVIPGVNEFLPLSATPEILFGLLIGLVVHEGGHGIFCRVGDIEIKSMGLALFTLIPVGAFVEPDEESQERADRGARTRMFAAAVMNNFFISVVALALLFGPVIGAIAPVSGVPVGSVFPGSSADGAGIERGDVITAVNGTAVENESELDAVLRDHSSKRVAVAFENRPDVVVERSLLMAQAAPGVIRGEGITVGDGKPPTIESVNGTAVHTRQDFTRVTSNRTTMRLETTNGTATIPVGVSLAQIVDGGPLSESDASLAGVDSFIITRIADQRVTNAENLTAVMQTFEPGETVDVRAVVDGTERTYSVTLSSHPREANTAYLGIVSHLGVSGITVNDLGVDIYPSEFFISYLGGETDGGGPTFDSFAQRTLLVVQLPLLGALSDQISYGFAGFVGPVTNFYEVTGPLSFLGGGVFTLANVLFWAGWLNLQLGWFNCIPSFPLDGGHILRTATESVVSRLPIAGKRKLTVGVTVAASLAMILSLILMIFGPDILTP